jgi:hypothetical protein
VIKGRKVRYAVIGVAALAIIGGVAARVSDKSTTDVGLLATGPTSTTASLRVFTTLPASTTSTGASATTTEAAAPAGGETFGILGGTPTTGGGGVSTSAATTASSVATTTTAVALTTTTTVAVTTTVADTGGTTVYITDTGTKYHRSGCRYLKESQHAISLADAKAQGYEPCKVCDPPR